MNTALVTLQQREIKWFQPTDPLFVGKDILELLSSSMYVDPMCMYREYIQNAADSIDAARLAQVMNEAARVEIKIDPIARTILIRDNGIAIGKDTFIRQLTALGGSKKRGTTARGFRGVGRLSGLAFCQELIFRSRQANEIEVHELRWDSKLVKSLLRNADDSCDLRTIVAKAIQVRDIPGRGWPQRFFEVELRGVVRHRDDRLLNADHVETYLSQVAPVPFSPEFQFGDEITSFLERQGIQAGCIDVEISGRGPVYRPHRNRVQVGKRETRFNGLTTILTPGRDSEIAAVTWILHHDYLGSFPSKSNIEGWRIRSGDIQIGDRDLLQSLFPEPRFNNWCVAETHILDPRIMPNGRRDHFEQNAHYYDLLNHLTPHTRDIAQRCRNSSVSRNLRRSIEKGLSDCSQNLRILDKGLIGKDAASKLSAQLLDGVNRLERLSQKVESSSEGQADYGKEVERLRNRITKMDIGLGTNIRFAHFKPSHRALLAEVVDAIYQSSPTLLEAQNLVDKIMTRLKRTNERRRRINKAGGEK